MITFRPHELPVADSMLDLAEGLARNAAHPVQPFMCLWVAFNNVYTTVGERNAIRPIPNGTRTIAGLSIPKMIPVAERRLLDRVFDEFGPDLRASLVSDPATNLFVNRTPAWRGNLIQHDPTGQRLNGVINVGSTLSAVAPVWSPIDMGLYARCQGGDQSAATIDPLAKQILDVLYTIRNNTFHGAKALDDANDRDVLTAALPLMRTIIAAFFPFR